VAFRHIMLDLETLDTASSAVVTSIGAVAFDPYTAGYAGFGAKFYVELVDDMAAQQQRGRTISGDTVRWWMWQGQAAQRLFSDLPDPEVQRVATVTALTMFSDFVERNGGRNAEIWGNGADFDNVILGSLYEAFDVKRPWSYSRNRCYRTMRSLHWAPTRTDRFGVHHNALDDAITQAEHLQKIMAAIGGKA
jgi:hypothetical protein